MTQVISNEELAQLWDEWRQQCVLREADGHTMQQLAERWRQETDPQQREALWARYMDAYRLFEISAACANVAHARWVFANHGIDGWDLPTPEL